MFFGRGRAAFLEFLRNLTPQIVFLTLGLIIGARIDFQSFQPDWQGLKNLAPFLMCVAVFLGSLAANTTRFIETAVFSNEELDIELQRLRAKQLGALRAILALLLATWRLNRRALVEIILAIAFAYTGCYVAIFMAAQSAAAALQSMQ